MITAEPDITRLLARLRALKLIRQQRDKRDRRVVWTHISPAGLALLAETDPVVQNYPKELLGHLGNDQLATLINLVELARRNCGDTQAQVSCEEPAKPARHPSQDGKLTGCPVLALLGRGAMTARTRCVFTHRSTAPVIASIGVP